MKGLQRGEVCMILCVVCFLLVCAGHYCSGNQKGVSYQVTVSRHDQPSPAGEVVQMRDWPKTLLPGERIDLNTASEKDLQRLPQIGAQRAEDIVAWREKRGPFRRIEDLKKVSGIGEGIFSQIEQYIKIGEVG